MLLRSLHTVRRVIDLLFMKLSRERSISTPHITKIEEYVQYEDKCCGHLSRPSARYCHTHLSLFAELATVFITQWASVVTAGSEFPQETPATINSFNASSIWTVQNWTIVFVIFSEERYFIAIYTIRRKVQDLVFCSNSHSLMVGNNIKQDKPLNKHSKGCRRWPTVCSVTVTKV